MLSAHSRPTDEKYHIETGTSRIAIKERTRKWWLLECLAVSAMLRIVTMSLYLGYRIRCLLVGDNTLNITNVAIVWLFFTIEILFVGKLMISPIYIPQFISTAMRSSCSNPIHLALSKSNRGSQDTALALPARCPCTHCRCLHMHLRRRAIPIIGHSESRLQS